jgi:hypothetical protein
MARYTTTDLETAASKGDWPKFLTIYKDLNPPIDPNSASELARINERAATDFDSYSSGLKRGTPKPTPKSASLFAGAEAALKSQESGGYYKEISESVTSSNAMSLVRDDSGFLSPDKMVKNILEAGYGQITDEYQNQKRLLEDINKSTGLTGQLSRDYRTEIEAAGPRLAQLGISYETLAESAKSLLQNSGRFNIVNQETFERAGAVGQAFVGSMGKLVEMVPEFEKVGIGAKGTIDSVERAGKSSLQLGLNSQKVAEGLKTNIGLLNQYGFQKGIDGLARMVQKSIEFKLSMESVAQVAEAVFTPEKALDVAANLQVLGGAIGDFNDPLKLMYMATNNVEGLQDAIINAASSLSTYNQEQGRFEVTGVNLRKVREMAAALGMDYKELSKTAIATQERLTAKEMLSGLGIQDEDKEFLTNLSQMKDGKMSIDISGSQKLQEVFGGLQEVSVDNLTDSQAQTLLQYRDEFKELSSNQIVRNQASDIENIRRNVSFLVKSVALTGTRAVKELADKMGINLKTYADATQELAPKIADGVNGALRDIVSGVPDFSQRGKVESPTSTLTEDKAKQIAAEEAKKQMEAATSQSNKNVNVTVTHDVKGGATLMDGWRREVIKDPSVFSDFYTSDKNEYTTPDVAVKK